MFRFSLNLYTYQVYNLLYECIGRSVCVGCRCTPAHWRHLPMYIWNLNIKPYHVAVNNIQSALEALSKVLWSIFAYLITKQKFKTNSPIIFFVNKQTSEVHYFLHNVAYYWFSHQGTYVLSSMFPASNIGLFNYASILGYLKYFQLYLIAKTFT